MGLATIITVWANRKKNRAETNFLTIEAYSLGAEEMRKQIDDLRKEVRELRDNEKEYKRIIAGYEQRERGHLARISELEKQLTIIVKTQTVKS